LTIMSLDEQEDFLKNNSQPKTIESHYQRFV
jgi:hypothetical protein